MLRTDPQPDNITSEMYVAVMCNHIMSPRYLGPPAILMQLQGQMGCHLKKSSRGYF
jgi:hypothetical protein